MAMYPWSFHIRWRLTDILRRPIYIAFGANLGNTLASFRGATKNLEQGGVRIIAVSGLWQSPSWPAGTDAPDYINACAQVEFNGSAPDLLERLHKVESAMGRERSALNAPRTLDLDLLDFRGQCLEAPDIQIPHPRIMSRGFVLFPLSQIAPYWQHPKSHMRIDKAISHLPLDEVSSMKYLGRQDFSSVI